MIHPLADIVGTGAAASIAPTSGTLANWVQIAVAGSGTVRIGDSTASSSLGSPIGAGGSQFLPYKGPLNLYPLASIYLYIPIGATAYVLYDA